MHILDFTCMIKCVKILTNRRKTTDVFKN